MKNTFGTLFVIRSIVLCAFFLCSTLIFAQEQEAPLSILTKGHNHSFFARQKALQTLSRDLDSESIQVMYDFMDAKMDPALSRVELLALKDAVCTKLDTQKKYPSNLPDRLMQMYTDQEHHEDWRNYCIQHLNIGFKNATEEQRAAICEIFWKATEEHHKAISGTALIALNDNGGDVNISKNDIAAKSLEIINNKSSCGAAKTSALQICAQLAEKNCLPAARELIAESYEISLRLSAVAVLGILGNEDDLNLLQNYTSDHNRLVKNSVNVALRKINQRKQANEQSNSNTQQRGVQ